MNSHERPRFARLDEPNRWALTNRDLLARIWGQFVTEEDWPNGRLLQRELFSKGQGFDLDEFALGIPPMLGGVDPSTGKIHLTPRGLSFVLAARPVLDSMVELVRIAVKRYADTTGEPVISSAEFEGLLGIDRGRSRLLVFALLEDRWLFRAAGGAVNEGQRFQVDERAVQRVREVHTIEDYLDAQAATWYPEPPRPKVPEPGSALADGQNRDVPAGPADRGARGRRASWWKRHRTDVGVIAAVGSAVAAIVAIVVTIVMSGGGRSLPTSSTSGRSGPSSKPSPGRGTDRPARRSTNNSRAAITHGVIRHVVATQVSATAYRVSWSNPNDPSIAGWMIYQNAESTSGNGSGAPYPGPRLSTQVVNTANFQSQFQFRAGQRWKICVAPFGRGLTPAGNYPVMDGREGCSLTFVWR